MESSVIKKQDQTLATIIHLSVFSKLFIPFGNFIFPVIIWLISKEKAFVNHHGRNAVNFQLSLLLYYIIIACLLIATTIILGARIPNEFFEYHQYYIKIYPGEDNNFSQFLVIFVTGALFFLGLIIFELYAVISAAKNASEGKEFKFPLSINFIREDSPENEPLQ